MPLGHASRPATRLRCRRRAAIQAALSMMQLPLRPRPGLYSAAALFALSWAARDDALEPMMAEHDFDHLNISQTVSAKRQPRRQRECTGVPRIHPCSGASRVNMARCVPYRRTVCTQDAAKTNPGLVPTCCHDISFTLAFVYANPSSNRMTQTVQRLQDCI